MKLHYLQHVPFEGLGSIENWAKNNDAVITCTKLYNNESLPEEELFDWLVVMGGPMNIHQEDRYPWLIAEKTFIGRAIAKGKKILGVCLGAQLIADILGAKVYPNKHKEIGWFSIQAGTKLPPALYDIFSKNIEVLHWHGDTFDLPRGASLLASSAACRNQGFIYDKIIALQFHLEITENNLRTLIENCADELVDGEYIQKAEDMQKNHRRFAEINQMMDKLLDYMKD